MAGVETLMLFDLLLCVTYGALVAGILAWAGAPPWIAALVALFLVREGLR
jgi:hypothetical protein